MVMYCYMYSFVYLNEFILILFLFIQSMLHSSPSPGPHFENPSTEIDWLWYLHATARYRNTVEHFVQVLTQEYNGANMVHVQKQVI